MTQISRRNLLLASSAVTLVAACTPAPPSALKSPERVAGGTFRHGVASGDPAADKVIIWTALTVEAGDVAQVRWEVDKDPDFASLTKSGTITTSAAQDWTVKIDVTDLDPGQTYYYRFRHGDAVSPAGRTKTLPQGRLDKVRFAVVSCCNWEAGFFNAYDHIARDNSFDAVIHLGDYFYEYGTDGWGGDAGEGLGRIHYPPHEILSLADYRARHAQYRSDPNLQDMTANHPMIAMWDDHESANDSWQGGAQNHNEGEGDWSARKAVAMQAYFEWMPMRAPQGQDNNALYSAYSYGDLLTLVTSETRLTARAEPINIDQYTKDMQSLEDAQRFSRDVLYAPDRHMHGPEQMDFIVDAMASSKAAGQPWRVLGNQVVMGKVHTADLGPYVMEEAIASLEKDWPAVRDFVRSSAFGLPVYPDSWDGYPWAREQFYERLKTAGITDIVAITGDAHEFWANDLIKDCGEKMGVELGTSSVTSPTLVKYFGDSTASYSLLLTQNNPDIRYYNPLHNGYIDLTFGRKTARAKFVIVDTVHSRDYAAREVAAFTLRKSKGSVKFAAPKGLSLPQRALFSGLG